jgi:hypothetical protein
MKITTDKQIAKSITVCEKNTQVVFYQREIFEEKTWGFDLL